MVSGATESAGAEQATGPAAPRRRGSKSLGVVLVQGLNSVTTVVQMALFAIVLPRAEFDDYAVWVTSSMFLVGLAQAVGTERVVIGQRRREDGTESARVLALLVAVAQLGVSLALQNPALVACSVASYVFVTYDFQRFVRCYDEARLFLRRDLLVLGLQLAAVLLVWAVVGDRGWLVVCWWGVGLIVWGMLGHAFGGYLRDGVRVLRDDARECLPLLADAALAGVPLVAALALARAQGAEGDASAARMAFTILGPITVLGMSARRVVYQRVGSGSLSPRFTVVWTGVVVATFVVCAALLTLTRTPLYPWAFPGFTGLAWVAIVGFAINHAAMFSTLLPAASLRAERRSFQVGTARVLATAAAVVAGALLLPFDSPGDVAWCVAVGSIGYALSLAAARLVTPQRQATQEVGS